MPFLTNSEAHRVSDSFLSSLYGDEVFRRWTELKHQMQFITEREYVNWLIDVANQYMSEDESMRAPAAQQAGQGLSLNMKSEVDLEQYDTQNYGNPYNTSVTGYSQTPSNTGNSGNLAPIDQMTENEANIKPEPSNFDSQKSVLQHSDAELYQQDTDDYNTSNYNVQDKKMLNIEEGAEIILSSDDEVDGDEPEASESGRMDDAENGGQHYRNPIQINREDKRYCCRHCEYKSDNKYKVQRHVKTVHHQMKPFRCEYCSCQFAQNDNLKRHLIGMHGYKSKYQCDRCLKYFHTPGQLQREHKNCKTHKMPTHQTMDERHIGPSASPATE